MLKVGIYTPYVKNEITLAAVQLADWLVRCGLDVSILAEGKVESGIHATWDRRVRRAKDQAAVCRWAYGTTHLCWFTPSVWAHDSACLVASDGPRRRTRHVFFPHWGDWKPQQLQFFPRMQRTICLSQDLAIWMDEKYSKLETKRTWANLVSPAVPLIPKHGLVDAKQRRLLVILDRSTVADLGLDIFLAFRQLLKRHSELRLTFLFCGALPRKYQQQVLLLNEFSHERVSFVGNPAYSEYSYLARQHDWVYLATTQHRLGALLPHLAVTTVPLICHDVPPVGGHVVHQVTGKLIPCDLREHPVPTAVVDVQEIIKAVESVLVQEELYIMGMQHAIAAQLVGRQAVFEKFITHEFVQ